MVFLPRYKHTGSEVVILTSQQYKKSEQNKPQSFTQVYNIIYRKATFLFENVYLSLPQLSLTPLQKGSEYFIISFFFLTYFPYSSYFKAIIAPKLYGDKNDLKLSTRKWVYLRNFFFSFFESLILISFKLSTSFNYMFNRKEEKRWYFSYIFSL